jgi:hypothetical protein
MTAEGSDPPREAPQYPSAAIAASSTPNFSARLPDLSGRHHARVQDRSVQIGSALRTGHVEAVAAANCSGGESWLV